ncbi:circularly permutated Ras protein 1-like isoform X4 [Ambystoma mexicanum]|uniref:circularly permutated Ras protein 1-like isoform X4 n=1 Tax=Ambystoma mexicanum TaxID=8296 RepID=UPI0037E88022
MIARKSRQWAGSLFDKIPTWFPQALCVQKAKVVDWRRRRYRRPRARQANEFGMEFCCRYFYIADTGRSPCSLSTAPQAPTPTATGPVASNINPYDNDLSGIQGMVSPSQASPEANGGPAQEGPSDCGLQGPLTQTLRANPRRPGDKERSPETHPLPNIPGPLDPNRNPYDNDLSATQRMVAPSQATSEANGGTVKKGRSGFRDLLTQMLRSKPSQTGDKKTHPLPNIPGPLDPNRNPYDNDLSATQRMVAPSQASSEANGGTVKKGEPAYLDILSLPCETSHQPSIYPELPCSPVPPPVPPRNKKCSMVRPSEPAPELLPANCNIVLFNIGKLVDVMGESASEGPLFCQECAAALSARVTVESQELWRCEFCGASLPVDDNSAAPTLGNDRLYLGPPDPAKDPHSNDDPLLVFCIDTSGSMCVTSKLARDEDREGLYTTRMQAVKEGLLQCLAFLKEKNPMTRISLVTFSDQVVLHGDGTQAPQILQDCELLDQDYLRAQGHHQALPHHLTASFQYLERAILRLKENGATALGPAALVSIAIASQKPGSKVIICTDGKANTDLGNLEDCTEDIMRQYAKLFYTDLAEFAMKHSVVVSVLTIEGTDCSLLELGQLASNTGGKVNIVPPLELSSEFQSILEDEVIATNVKLKIFLPPSMFFLYEEHTLPTLEHPIGSATKDTGITFEFNAHESKYREVLRYSELPFQAQLTFMLPDGQPAIRILSEKKPVTNDSSAAEDAIDVGVLQMHSAQVSARLAMEGRVEEARSLALAQKELIGRVMSSHNGDIRDTEYEEWENAMSPIYEDLHAYRKQNGLPSRDSHDGSNFVTKTFSDEMASMMFRLKHAKQKVLRKFKPVPAQ